jgi:hypothetical protein
VPLTCFRFAFALGLVVSAGAAPAVGDELIISVRLRNDAGKSIAHETVERARARVSRLYASHGIRVVWVADRPQLTLVLLSRQGGQQMHQVFDAIGYAPASGADNGRIAYVLQHRVERIARGYGTEQAVVLAGALAHELGHLLLPSKPHARTGLMSVAWNQADFRKMRERQLRFTDDQAGQIRELS